jgi:hypothetical protein
MPLVRAFENRDYWPEYGTLVIRDVPASDRSRRQVSELLAQYALDTQPSGSVARAGDGWVEGVASGDHRHTVRLEVHNSPPPDDDLPAWADVLDTPFITSGLVRLALTTGGSVGEPFELGRPGRYRIQYARRPVVAGQDPEGSPCEYRLRFWPVATPPEPPRWLRRSGPLVDRRPAAERDAFDGSYRSAITDIVMVVLWAEESASSVTLAGLADRLLTSTATVRDVIEHPRTSRVLIVDGDLDDVDAALAMAFRSAAPANVRIPPLPALPSQPGSAARRPTAARPATLGVRGGAQRAAVRPMVAPQDVADTAEGTASGPT